MHQEHTNLGTAERVVALLESIEQSLHQMAVGQADAHCGERIDAHHTYTRTQAARLLGVSVWSVDQARKKGVLIEARRIGQRDVRITGESLLVFMESQKSASVRVRRL